MNKSYRKGFTLVELLAVIVILAIILVIAVPKIMSVITDSKKASLETSAKMIASAAEKMKMQKELLGEVITGELDCKEFTKVTSDYEQCIVKFDGNTAKVNITGANKFEGLSVCGGTKTQATAQTEICTTDGKYFSYEFRDAFVYSAEVKDVSKCTAYLNKKYPNTDDWPTAEEENAQRCNGTYDGYRIIDAVRYGDIPSTDFEEAGLDVKWKTVEVEDVSKCTTYLNSLFAGNETINSALCNGTYERYTIFDVVRDEDIPSADFEIAGLSLSNANIPSISITNYDVKGGYGLVIPKEIDGYKVTKIGYGAFVSYYIDSVVLPETLTTIGAYAFRWDYISSIVIPESVKNIESYAFESNDLTSIIIPSGVTSIGAYAFANNPLTKVYLENPNIKIGNCAFGIVDDLEEHNLSDTYECIYDD